LQVVSIRINVFVIIQEEMGRVWIGRLVFDGEELEYLEYIL
jgi:hypothetical protein